MGLAGLDLQGALITLDRIFKVRRLITGRIVHESAKTGARPELLRRHLGVR